MKKIFIVLLALVLVLSFAACGEDDTKKSDPKDGTTLAQTVEEGDLLVVSTPYADLKLPASYEGKVTNKVTSEDPYTVTFSTVEGDTELFSIIFNGEGDVLMGTLIGEKENTVIYISYADLDPEDQNYEANVLYQEDADTIVNHLKTDYDFMINQIVLYEDDETFDIQTNVTTLKYPAQWKDKVTVDVSDDAVRFSYGDNKLFDLSFVETEDGFLIGKYQDTPIYLVNYELTQGDMTELEFTELNLMQEDNSVILTHLVEDPNFVLQ